MLTFQIEKEKEISPWCRTNRNFIPFIDSLHWSLLVICHPGDAANFKGKFLLNEACHKSLEHNQFLIPLGCHISDDDVLKSLRVPCILHLDSIKGSHTGLKKIVQRYPLCLMRVCVYLFIICYHLRFYKLISH